MLPEVSQKLTRHGLLINSPASRVHRRAQSWVPRRGQYRRGRSCGFRRLVVIVSAAEREAEACLRSLRPVGHNPAIMDAKGELEKKQCPA